MKAVVAILMGLISAFLLNIMASMIFVRMDAQGIPEPTSGTMMAVVLFGGWVISSVLLLRNARTVSTVFRRGFLLGAGEWLAMAGAGIVYSSKLVAATTSAKGAPGEAAGAAIGGGLITMITGGVSVFMAVVCLIGFAIAYFAGREAAETRASTATKKCPQCAEMVQQEALKCRFCGHNFASAPSPA